MLDREGDYPRISTELDEWRPRHSTRSPRKGWGRSHRISKSRSRSRSRSRNRSRSRSPLRTFRQEPTVTDRNRGRSGASAHICRDFAAGRCRRGNNCHFLHQDSELYDSRRHLDDREGGRRRTGTSKYSPDDNKGHAIRTEKFAHICNDFLKGRCRRGESCRFVHRETAVEVFEKGPVEDVYKNKDPDHRSRELYSDHNQRSRDSYPDHGHRSRDPSPDRNHEYEPPRKGETPCKFFASGNCQHGTRCRFSHQVKDSFSSERSRDDRRDLDRDVSHGWDGPRWNDATISTAPVVQGWEEDKNENQVRIQGGGRDPDHKYEGDRIWDGPTWTDATTVPIFATVHGWGEDKNEVTEVANDITRTRPGDNSWSHDILTVKSTWDTPASLDKSQNLDNEEPLQWKAENNVPAMVLSTSRGGKKLSGDVEISARDIKQQGVNSSTSEMPCISNITFPAVQQDSAVEASCEKHYPADFQEQKVFIDSFGEKNPSHKDNKPGLYSGEMKDVGDHDGPGIIADQPINAPQGQCIFQPDKSANIHPISHINPFQGQSQLPVLSHPAGGEIMKVSHNLPSFRDNKDADKSSVVSLAPPAFAPTSATAHSEVSQQQLEQLSNLTASLIQLLENRKQLSQLPSAVTNLPNSAAPVPPVSGVMIQLNHVPEAVKQYHPVCNSIEPKMSNMGNQLLPSVEQKSSDNELHPHANYEIHHGNGNLNQKEHLASTKGEENGTESLVGGNKAPENGPSKDVGADDGAHDKKMKESKEIRPFKFALVEFVKELLKPSWKDGQVSKDVYKIIVKKAVDKVMETLGPQVPQTKDKIDLYLSCSKQRIDKLVQAYVGKHQKS
ncbi:zinc finger CCCH domain-containing protein 55-like isoform X2 [Amaranthus tricolor]|nr:zinc finger CCCH domain-containing protein 55-like isoform X2 [Amaranthus tricolor]